MVKYISEFQSGRLAAMAGLKRDGRRSKEWIEGYDQTKRAKDASYASR
jgi:hypothetical protein